MIITYFNDSSLLLTSARQYMSVLLWNFCVFGRVNGTFSLNRTKSTFTLLLTCIGVNHSSIISVNQCESGHRVLNPAVIGREVVHLDRSNRVQMGHFMPKPDHDGIEDLKK